MSHSHATRRSDRPDRVASRAVPTVENLLRLTFIHGPRKLVTSRISRKCAAIMTALCTPSLLCCSLLTLPALLFRSPQQHAYYYFSQTLNEDPARWLVMLLAMVCALFALAVPALMPAPRSASEY